MKTAVIAAILLILPAVAAGQGAAYNEDVLRQAREIYNQIMSPYCPGKTLSNCSSGAAEELRADIRSRLAAGETPEMIIQSLVEEFGESVLAAPPNEGVGRLAWLTPFVAIVFGLAVIVAFVRRYYRPAPPAATSPAPDAGLRARVEEELESHER
jgi:cytochrome c-type biogenesis protein CcmH